MSYSSNPALLAAAELFTDGAITARILRDIPAIAGLPAYAMVQTDPVAAAQAARARELANARAAVAQAERTYDSARREIGEANRTHSAPVLCGGRVVMAAAPFTPERMRARKSAAFRLFNLCRAQLAAARRRLAAAVGL
jgi:hypothetical protein